MTQNVGSQGFAAELDTVIRCPGHFSARLPALKLTGSGDDSAYVRPMWLAKEAKQTPAEVLLALFERERHLPVLSAQASRRRMCNDLTMMRAPDDATAANLGAAIGVAVDWRAGIDYCAAGLEGDASSRDAVAADLLRWLRSALDLNELPREGDKTYAFQFSHRLAEGLVREAVWIDGPDAGNQFKDSASGRGARDSRGANVGGCVSISPITAVCGNWFSQGVGGGKIESIWGCPIDCGPDGAPRTTYVAKGSSGYSEFAPGTTYNYSRSVGGPSALRLGANDNNDDEECNEDQDDVDEDSSGDESSDGKKRRDTTKASEAGRSAIPPQKGMIVVRSDALVARPSISLGTITEQRIYSQSGDSVDWNATYAWRKFALSYAIYALSRTLSVGLMNIRANCSLRVVDRNLASVQFFDNFSGDVGALRVNLFEDALAIRQTVETCAQELVDALGGSSRLMARLRPQSWELYQILSGHKSDGAPVELIERVKTFAEAELKAAERQRKSVATAASSAKSKKRAKRAVAAASESEVS